MQSLVIVNGFDEAPDAAPSLDQVSILRAVDFLVLQRLHKRFSLSVIVGIAAPAHADSYSPIHQQIGISSRSILRSSIRMVYETGLDTATLDPHYQSLNIQVRFQRSSQRPADHPARK